MVEISDRSSGFGFIAGAGVRRGARALSQLASAAGREVELTQTNLRTQAGNLNRLGNRVGALSVAINGVEEARGVIRSQELSVALTRATQRAVNRLLQAESLANGQMSTPVVGGGGTASIATALASALDNDTSPGGAIARALARSLGGGSGSGGTARQPTPFDIIVTAANSSQKRGDIFERQLPTQVRAGGLAGIEVSRRALEARSVNLVIDPASPDVIVPTVRAAEIGRATSSNEGFVVRARTGDRGGTLALDLGDPNGGDSRVSTVNITGGAGSDVLFVSGANDSEVRGGGGNDYIMADGNGMLYGGTGDDVIIGNNVFGEDGDDVLFGNTLAVGGAGNDRITMFSLMDDGEGTGGLAFGGDGDDIIIGDVEISADGGDGNDSISLRAGGFATGGAGNDTLTAFAEATLEGGAGNDDIMLLGGGIADGGDGNDDITAVFYATVSGGKGDDIVRMNSGGIYRFAKGDGRDQVLVGSPLTGQPQDRDKVNRIEISGFDYAEVDILISTNDFLILPRDPAVADRLSVTRTQPGDRFEMTFTNNGFSQTVSIAGNTQTPGPRNRVTA